MCSGSIGRFPAGLTLCASLRFWISLSQGILILPPAGPKGFFSDPENPGVASRGRGFPQYDGQRRPGDIVPIPNIRCREIFSAVISAVRRVKRQPQRGIIRVCLVYRNAYIPLGRHSRPSREFGQRMNPGLADIFQRVWCVVPGYRVFIPSSPNGEHLDQ